MDNNAPATKQDLAAAEARLSDRIKQDLAAAESRLSEQLRDMQTELLKAFLPWQEQVRIQFHELDSNTATTVQAIKQRMEVLERRLSEIEKKLLLEPPAA